MTTRSRKQYLPIQIRVADRGVLVIGATRCVQGKLSSLRQTGARITVVTNGDMAPSIERLARAGQINVHRRRCRLSDLRNKVLVFWDPSEPLTEGFLRKVLAQGIPLCKVDRPAESTFISPAVVWLSDLSIAFGTGGISPGLLKILRRDLSRSFSDARLAEFLRRLETLRASLPEGARSAGMRKAVSGFGVDVALRFPAWLEDRRGPKR